MLARSFDDQIHHRGCIVCATVVSKGPVHSLDRSLFKEACQGIAALQPAAPVLSLDAADALSLPEVRLSFCKPFTKHCLHPQEQNVPVCEVLCLQTDCCLLGFCDDSRSEGVCMVAMSHLRSGRTPMFH